MDKSWNASRTPLIFNALDTIHRSLLKKNIELEQRQNKTGDASKTDSDYEGTINSEIFFDASPDTCTQSRDLAIESDINLNVQNLRNTECEKLSRMCRDGACYCFSSDSDFVGLEKWSLPSKPVRNRSFSRYKQQQQQLQNKHCGRRSHKDEISTETESLEIAVNNLTLATENLRKSEQAGAAEQVVDSSSKDAHPTVEPVTRKSTIRILIRRNNNEATKKSPEKPIKIRVASESAENESQSDDVPDKEPNYDNTEHEEESSDSECFEDATTNEDDDVTSQNSETVAENDEDDENDEDEGDEGDDVEEGEEEEEALINFVHNIGDLITVKSVVKFMSPPKAVAQERVSPKVRKTRIADENLSNELLAQKLNWEGLIKDSAPAGYNLNVPEPTTPCKGMSFGRLQSSPKSPTRQSGGGVLLEKRMRKIEKITKSPVAVQLFKYTTQNDSLPHEPNEPADSQSDTSSSTIGPKKPPRTFAFTKSSPIGRRTKEESMIDNNAVPFSLYPALKNYGWQLSPDKSQKQLPTQIGWATTTTPPNIFDMLHYEEKNTKMQSSQSKAMPQKESIDMVDGAALKFRQFASYPMKKSTPRRERNARDVCNDFLNAERQASDQSQPQDFCTRCLKRVKKKPPQRKRSFRKSAIKKTKYFFSTTIPMRRVIDRFRKRPATAMMNRSTSTTAYCTPYKSDNTALFNRDTLSFGSGKISTKTLNLQSPAPAPVPAAASTSPAKRLPPIKPARRSLLARQSVLPLNSPNLSESPLAESIVSESNGDKSVPTRNNFDFNRTVKSPKSKRSFCNPSNFSLSPKRLFGVTRDRPHEKSPLRESATHTYKSYAENDSDITMLMNEFLLNMRGEMNREIVSERSPEEPLYAEIRGTSTPQPRRRIMFNNDPTAIYATIDKSRERLAARRHSTSSIVAQPDESIGLGNDNELSTHASLTSLYASIMATKSLPLESVPAVTIAAVHQFSEPTIEENLLVRSAPLADAESTLASTFNCGSTSDLNFYLEASRVDNSICELNCDKVYQELIKYEKRNLSRESCMNPSSIEMDNEFSYDTVDCMLRPSSLQLPKHDFVEYSSSSPTTPKSNSSMEMYRSLRDKLRNSFRKSKQYFQSDRKQLTDCFTDETQSLQDVGNDGVLAKRLDGGGTADEKSADRKAEILYQSLAAKIAEIDRPTAMLIEHITHQRSVRKQMKNAVNICRVTHELESTPELIEAERLLLVSNLKETESKKQLVRLCEAASDTFSKPPHEHRETLTIKYIEFPLRKIAIYDLMFNYFYICVATHENQVRCSMPEERVGDTVFFRDLNMKFTNLEESYSVTLEVYVLRLRKNLQTIRHEQTNRGLKKHSKSFLFATSPRLSPAKLFRRSSSSSTLPRKFDFDSEFSRFKTQGKCSISAMAIAKKGSESGYIAENNAFAMLTQSPSGTKLIYTMENLKSIELQSVPYNSNLIGPIVVGVHSSIVRDTCEMSGFLNVGETHKEVPMWNRRWCKLNGASIDLWNYPQNSSVMQLPLASIDLEKVVANEVGLADTAICNRARTIMLTTNETDYFLSADTQQELNQWTDCINSIIGLLRKWNAGVQ